MSEAQLERRRINKDPKRAIEVFRQMKNECFGITPCRKALAERLLGLALAEVWR